VAYIVSKPQLIDDLKIVELLQWFNENHIPIRVFDRTMETLYYPVIQFEDVQEMIQLSKNGTLEGNMPGLKCTLRHMLHSNGILAPDEPKLDLKQKIK